MSYVPAQPGARRQSGGFPGLADLISPVVALTRRILRLWLNRRALQRLARLEDHYLADIALSRADIDWALSLPWHVDATAALANRVECRRASKRWAMRL